MSYQKAYATIVRRHEAGLDLILVAELDEGGFVNINAAQRLGGRTPSASLLPGLRVKIFQRPGDRSPHFRRVGR